MCFIRWRITETNCKPKAIKSLRNKSPFLFPEAIANVYKTTSCMFTPVVYGRVYTGPDPFGTGTKLVRISLLYTRDLVRIGSAIWYQMGPLMEVILCGTTVPFQFRTGPVYPYQSGSDLKRI